MDTAAFEQMYEAFWEFRSLFVPLFGRRESRDHRQNYLRAFLVHSPRPAQRREFHRVNGSLGWAIQRFVTKAPWDHDAVIDRLEEYLAPWLGKVAYCQVGMFLAYVSPLGRALVDKRLYLPESWTSD